MPVGTKSVVSEFVFLGLANQPELKIALFTLLMLVYAVAVLGQPRTGFANQSKPSAPYADVFFPY